MRMTFGLAVLALLGATGYAAFEWHRLHAAESALAAARIQRTQAHFTPRERAQATRPAAAATVKKPEPDAGFLAKLETLKAKAPKGPGGVPLIYPEELFDRCPSLREAYLRAKEGHIWLMYGPFFADAGLTKDEMRQFCAICMEREIACLEMRKLLPRSDPASEKSPVRAEMNREAEAQRKAKLVSVLGSDRYSRLEKFEEEIDGRRLILGLHNMVATTYYTEQPVSAAQMNQLSALATQWGMFDLAKAATLQDPFGQIAVGAASILSPQQLEIFDLMLDYQQLSFAKWQIYSASSH